MRQLLPFLLILAPIMSLACGGGSGTTTPASASPVTASNPSPPGVTSRGTFTAVIDGNTFVATEVIASIQSGILGLSGLSAGRAMELQIAGPATVGPSPAAVGRLVEFPSLRSWATGGSNGGSATLTISTLSANGASGTFSFSAPPSAGVTTGATGTRTVTNGVFSVTF